MPDFKINGRIHNDVQILKLKKGQDEAAFKAASSSKNGTDDVFFKVGQDTFVASGRGLLDHKGLYFFNKVDDRNLSVEYDGQKREITKLQNQANTAKEGMLWGMQLPGLGALSFGVQALLKRNFVFAGIAAGAFALLGLGGFLYGKHRTAGFGDLNQHGTVVQKDSMPQGGLKAFFQKLLPGK